MTQPSKIASSLRNPPGAAQGGQHENSATETLARLQRGVLRLALSYHGRSPALDLKLKQLGTMVRQGRSGCERQRLIDDIVNDIVSLELSPDSSAKGASDPDEELDRFLDALALPVTLAPELEHTRRVLKTVHEKAARLTQLRHLADNISTHLMHSADSYADAPAMRALLLELLERAPVDKQTMPSIAPLRSAIEQAHDRPGFIDCVERLNALTDAARARATRELEALTAYLRTTAARLRDFDRFVHQSDELSRGSEADTVQLSETMRCDLDAIRSEAERSEDLDALKSAIDNHLDSIDDGLEAFVSAQKSRSTKANDAIERMKQQLAELESQTEILREDLEEQHARVLIDPLTGVLNRSGYAETATRQVARWTRYGGDLSLAVIDLDRFKHINDAYGHAAGDRVLATVAEQIGAGIRQSDVLCRYGGEEFVLILPETGCQQAERLLEKLRAKIEHCPFRHKDTPVDVTISAGVACFEPGDGLESVFERADAALYKAKQAGRNRVCLAAAVDVPGDDDPGKRLETEATGS